MVSFEQTRIVLERENIFALSVYLGACTELQVGPRADKSDQHSIWDELSSLDRTRPPKGGQDCVLVHLINPSEVSFGTAVITPRWLYVLAAATPGSYGDPCLIDETLEPMDPHEIQPGDVVGIGIHTANALRGYKIGNMVRERGAYAVFGGIHATLYPNEVRELGGAHAVVKGDGDAVWPRVLADCARGTPLGVYEGGRIEAS